MLKRQKISGFQRSRPWRSDVMPGRSRRGIVLPAVMILGLLMITMVSGLVAMSMQQTRTRARYEVYKDEFSAAEVALNKAYAQIKYMTDHHTANLKEKLAAVTAPTVPGYSFPKFKITETSSGNEPSEEYNGYPLYCLRYQIDVRAYQHSNKSSRNKHAGAAIRQEIKITYVPLHIYAIFYDPTMEVAPSPFMQVNGLVHSNSDSWFQSGNGLNFLKNVTIAGKVHHGRHPDYGTPDNSNGDVCFSRGSSLVSMKRSDADGWLTSLDKDWIGAAQAAWEGGLRDEGLGAKPLNLPIPASADPYSIIERASSDDSYALQQEKFEYKAGLKIVVDKSGKVTCYDADGNAVSLSYKDPKDATKTKTIYAMTTFYDAREAKTVTSVDLNLGNMIEGKIYPVNGILYVANEVNGSQPGVVRLVNGAELPKSSSSTGLSVATHNPLYIKGDFNTRNKSMAMVVTDAVNILSNAWDDKNASTYSARTASETTVNAVCIGGIVPTADSKYSGGVENFFRFLENWSGKKCTFNGSIICMWESRQAIGKWGGSNTYAPPNRYWAWDGALGTINGPPGAPPVIDLARTTWELQPGS